MINIDSKEIGIFVSKLIVEKFGSAREFCREYLKKDGTDETEGDNWKTAVNFYENGNIVSFRDTLAVTGIITNIANVTKKSGNTQITNLIYKLNKSYNNIRNISSGN